MQYKETSLYKDSSNGPYKDVPEGRIGLSPYQRDIWVAASQFPGLPQYTIHIYDRFRGNVDINRLDKAMSDVVRSCEVSRLRFGDNRGTPFQWLDEPSEHRIKHVDLTEEPDPDRAAQSWLDEAFNHSYDLGGPRLFDLAIIKTVTSTYAYVRTHHIVSDAWGLQIFMRQVRAEYCREIDEERVDYASFIEAVENATYLGSAKYHADHKYFIEALGDVEAPLFKRKGPNGSRRTERYTISLERALLSKIRNLGLSPFVAITGAVSLYLAKVHQSDDIIVGIPTLNRGGVLEKSAVGHFANTLPLRICADRNQSAGAFLAQIKDNSRALLQHQRMPLGDLMKSQSLLFDTTISYMRWPSPQAIAGIAYETTAETHAHDTDSLAIWVSEFDTKSDVRIDFEYACDIFNADFPISSVARHMETLLRLLLENIEAPIGSFDPLSADERHELVVERNATEEQFPDQKTLPELFAEQVERSPDAVALIEPDGRQVTFIDLARRASAVARVLRAKGIGTDDRVAIVMNRGTQLMPAIFGTQLAGGAYVPVDPNYPTDRISQLIEDCGARVLLLGEGLSAPADLASDVAVIHLPMLPSPACDLVQPMSESGALAYVIYTSGSSGKPKGVMVEHRSVVNRLWWMQRRYAIGPGDVILQKTPISFDVSVWELFWWSFAGASCSLLAAGAEKDPYEVLHTVARDGVTIIHFVPSMLSAMLDVIEADDAQLVAASSLRRVFCSGEALGASQVARFNRLFEGRVELVNLYGPTEATVDVSYFDCPLGAPSTIPIGRPIDNIQLYILDGHRQVQPAGAPGELFIGGVGVARGYLNRPELNDERFVPDIFSNSGFLYRTGDVARWLADGNIEYLGRADDQVKIRGNRVEPNEVRDHLAALSEIRDAAVVARHTQTRGTHLVAYYIADLPIDAADLRAKLTRTLPEFMVPAFFVAIDALPFTANGKLDRGRLPAPPEAVETVGPRTPLEADLCAIWAATLGVSSVGVLDNFYALGGDSILMLRLRAEARRRGLHFELADLIRHPSVAGLCAHVTRLIGPAFIDDLKPFSLVSEIDRPKLTGLEDAFPVSRLSLGLLYHTSHNPGSAIYRDVFRYRFDLAWDEAAFRSAVTMVVARFPALRSAFDLAGYSEPLQLVYPSIDPDVTVVRLDTHADPHASIADHIDRKRFESYRIDKPGLYAFAAFVGDDGFDLIFNFHHAILDGWSVASLISSLVKAYEDVPDAGEPPPLSAYVDEERRSLTSQADARYWTDRLAGATVTKLDSFARHEPIACAAASHRLQLPDALFERTKSLAAARLVPLRSLLLAVHCLTLHALAQTDIVVTGVVTHGRPDLPDADRMVGLFLNTMPVRSEEIGGTWFDVVLDIARQEQESHPHRRFPLSAIKDISGEALKTAFNYVNLHVFEGLPKLLDFDVWEETNFSPLINVIVDPAGRGPYVRVDPGEGGLGRDQVGLVARTYVGILRKLVDRPDERIDYSFLAPADAITRISEPLDLDVLARFDRQVAATPSAVAVSLGDDDWTYRDLDGLSRQVAAGLQRSGAKPGERIGIALGRSIEMIAAIWGTLRAGMVCLPLDVGYPKQRLDLIMAKAKPTKVIVDPDLPPIATDDLALPIDQVFVDLQPAEVADRTIDDVAVMIFTSGSTGEPKGVELPHRTWANYVEWQAEVPSGTPGSTTLQFAPLSFDVAFGEIFSTHCCGGELRLVSERDRLDPPALLRLIDAYDVERLMLPFVAFQRLADASNALGLRPRSLRVIITAGEQLRMTDDLRTFCAALPELIVENQYGPSEAYVVSAHALAGDPWGFPDLPPIGRPIDRVEILVLDAAMRPVPLGAAGEIFLGGDCLALGYHDAPALTRERFVDHPFRPGGRLYRTGDVGRILGNGDVVWLGRADDQVKVRGYRIEPAEVELAIMRQAAVQPGLRAAAVVARDRAGEDTFLAAFLTGDRRQIDIERIERELRTELPAYMIPSRFAFLDTFPLTPSGKRDDGALRNRVSDEVTLPQDAIAPRNATETALAALLAELLKLDRVGVRDNFFAIGGTSLTAMRFVVTIEKLFGTGIPISALIETPTIEGLAKRLAEGSEILPYDPLVPLRTAGERPPLYLVHPLGGHVACYLPLTRALSTEQPVYALQASGSVQGSLPLSSVSDMASLYLAAIKTVTPGGPYLLAGWSFGGFIAYEMARQLRASDPDARVRVVVIDSIAMPHDIAVTVGEDALLEFFFCELVWFERSEHHAEALPAGLTVDQKLDYISERAISAGVLPEDASRATVRRLYALFHASWQALIGYRPDIAEADVTLLRADGPLPASLRPMHDAAGTFYTDPKNGWQHWTTGTLEVIRVPGDHLNLMTDPHVAKVAAAITQVAELFGQTEDKSK